MPAVLRLYNGLSASQLTQQQIDLYRSALCTARESGEVGRTLWIAPTRRAAAGILRKLPDASLPVLLAPQVFTFDGFAQQVLDAAPQDIRPISGLIERMILRRIVNHRLDKGELSYFASVAETDGFLDLLQELISELKRDEIWPEMYQASARGRARVSPRHREFALLYTDYQEFLHQQKLYDVEGRFWAARRALEEGHWGRFADVRTVVLDGFSDLTESQFLILQALAQRVALLSVSVLREDSDGRSDLFARPARMAERLSRSGTVEEVTIPVEHPNESLFHLARQLFVNPREVQIAPRVTGVSMHAVAGQLGEFRYLVAEVKRKLLSGVPPEEIVICLRSLEESGPLCELLTEAGIPFACEYQPTLATIPAIRDWRRLLDLEANDWPVDALITMLQSRYADRQAAGPISESLRRKTVRQLRRWGILQGRQALLQVAERAAHAARSRIAAHEQAALAGGPIEVAPATEPGSSPVAVHPAAQREIDRNDDEALAAWQVLNWFHAQLARLRGAATWRNWIQFVLGIARESGYRSDSSVATDTSAAATDEARAWIELERLLFGVAESTETHFEAEELSLAEYLRQLDDLLAHATLNRNQPEQGRVLVLDALQTRHLDVPYLFIARLTERSFPKATRHDGLLSSTERQALVEKGLPLNLQRSQLGEEMLLFQQLLLRARRELWLSYPSVDDSGTPLSGSPYLAAVRELFPPDVQLLRHYERLDPLPEQNGITTLREMRLLATSQALEGDFSALAGVAERPDQQAALSQLNAAMQMADLRFQSSGRSRFEGQFEHPVAKQLIAARYDERYEFSATQLEDYAYCPFRYLTAQVMKIQPVPEFVQIQGFEQRGRLLHDVLAAMHQEFLGDRNWETLLDSQLPDRWEEQIASRFLSLLQERLEQQVTWDEVQAALVRIEKGTLGNWSQNYQAQWAQYRKLTGKKFDQPPVPVLFERAFGTDSGGTAVTPPLQLGSGPETVCIAGRIDRVDVGWVEQRPVFLVVDYKSGQRRTCNLKKLRAGQALQLAIYTLAVEKLSLLGQPVSPYFMGYWNLAENGFDAFSTSRTKNPLDQETWSLIQSHLEEVIMRLVSRLRRSEFPVFSLDQNCTSRCDYRLGCRVAQVRSLPEALQKGWDGCYPPGE